MSGVDISGGREPGDWAEKKKTYTQWVSTCEHSHTNNYDVNIPGADDGCWCECAVRPGAPSSGGSGMMRSKSLGFSQTDTRVILL